MSINKVILEGRLGQDPELKYLPNGTAVCNLNLATSESWNDKQGARQEKTEWHRIVVWGKLAERCNEYLKKGKQVLVEGSLQTRSWDDKTSGQKRYITEIKATNVQFLGAKGSAKSNDDNAPQEEETSSVEGSSFSSDDIPF